ncbi:MAG: MFS transporter [Candidatus Lokiarchaeota archaeon]|nr:MFS transporter [Candidatus Lokiarchaeota archaeon]
MPQEDDFNDIGMSEYPKINLNPLWIAVFTDILGFSILLPILPAILTNFNTNALVIGFLLSINAIFTVIFAPILGKLSDKYGRRPLLLISQAGTCVGFIILAFSTNIWIIFISRIIDGVFGGNFPIAKAIIGDAVPPKKRSIQMTNIGVCHTLASLAGPAIGGLLSIWGLFAPGIFAASLSGLTMIMTIFYIPETWTKEKRLKLKKERIQQNVHVKFSIRKNNEAFYLLIQFGFHTLSFFLYISSISLFAAVVFGFNAQQIGIYLMISGIFRVVIRFTIFKPILKKLGEINTLKVGLLSFVITFILLGFSRDPVSFMIILILVSFAASLTRGPFNSLISQSVSPKEQGIVNGYASSLDSFGQILGPLLGGLILYIFHPSMIGFTAGIFSLIAFVMIFNAGIYITIIKSRDRKAKET